MNKVFRVFILKCVYIEMKEFTEIIYFFASDICATWMLGNIHLATPQS